MHVETLIFRYVLTVLESRRFEVRLNGSTISSMDLSCGVTNIEGKFDTEFGQEYTVALSTFGQVQKPIAIINNIEVIWPSASSSIRPGGTILAQFEKTRPNEIWNYFDPNATQRSLKFANSPYLRTITLDYQRTEHPGNDFINNFGVFVGHDGVTDDLKNNDHTPYTITRAGEFQFGFRAPLAPWLLKRLFFQHRTV